MTDRNIRGIDDQTGRPILTGIRPASEWIPPSDRGVGLGARPRDGKPAPKPEPVAADPALDVESLEDFGDHVAAMTAELGKRDKNSWTLGEIALHFEITIGRPTNEDRETGTPTLNDLAREAGASPQRVSEWRNNAAYWPAKVRASVTLPDNLHFEHFAIARRHVNSDPELRPMAVALLKQCAAKHYSSDMFGDYLGNLRFYPPAVLHDKRYQDLDMLHFAIARKASGGVLDNALELLDAAVSLGLDVAKFRAYCAQAQSAATEAGKPVGTWVINNPATLREFVGRDLPPGTYTVTITRID
jgi:hypothetical protein